MAVAHTEINLPCRLSSKVQYKEKANNNYEDSLIFVKSKDNPITCLKEQLQAAHNNIIFLQQQHKQMLQGLFKEIERLQHRSQDLQMKLELHDIFVDEVALKKIKSLQQEVANCDKRNDILTKDLENANNVITSLNQELKLKELQHQQEIDEYKKVISHLEHELELKCSTLSELNARLKCAKKKSFFQKMSFSSPRLPFVSLPPFPKYRNAECVSLRSSPSPPYQDSRSFSFPENERLPSIHLSQMNQLSTQSNLQSSSSTLSNESLYNGFHDNDSFSTTCAGICHNTPSSIEKTASSNYLQRISNIVQPQSLPNSFDSKTVKLPPLRQLQKTPSRCHIRQQIRVQKDMHLSATKPNQFSSPNHKQDT